MDFYPKTLKRNWYLVDVCSYIICSLEGAKVWTSCYYEAKVERDAYLEAFQECINLVKKHNTEPQMMLQTISDLHDELLWFPKPPFFSMARWFYNPKEARDQAIRTAFSLVDGINTRFLS